MDALVQRLEALTRSSSSFAAAAAAWRVTDHRHQTPQTCCVTFAALFDWIDALRDAIRASQSNGGDGDRAALDPSTAALVVGVALPSCSVEESALVLAVAREPRWVYVPLDACAPLAQQAAVLRDARVDALVTTPEAPLARFLAANARELRLGGPARAVAPTAGGFRPTLVIPVSSPRRADAGWTELEGRARDGAAADPLYVLFTSGSSGRPKGVVGSRAGATNRLAWMWTQLPFAPPERVARVTKLTFVDSVAEILGALLRQAPLVHLEPAAPSSVVLDRTELFAHAAQTLQVTRVTLVPSVLEVLLLQLRAAPQLLHALASVRLLLVSGEVLPLRLARQVTTTLPHARLLNLFGSTEVSGDVTWAEVPAALSAAQAARWTRLGVPVGSVRNRVGDTELKLVADDGESVALQPETAASEASGAEQMAREGELLVAGSALALGYVARSGAAGGPDSQPSRSAGSDVTATTRWVPDDERAGRTWFRTGDICRVVGDELFFCGRRDALVKIRGQCVQLEAVERAVEVALAQVDAAYSAATASVVVLAVRDPSASGLSSLALVAFLLQASGERHTSQQQPPHQLHHHRHPPPRAGVVAFPQKAALLQQIRATHGAVFVPRDVVLVPADSATRLSSGKLDKASLQALYTNRVETGGDEATSEADAAGSGQRASRARRFVETQVRRLLVDVAARENDGDALQRTFQELGGNSLHATLFCWEARQALGCRLLPLDLLSSTLTAVVEALDAELAGGSSERDDSGDDATPHARAAKRAKRDDLHAAHAPDATAAPGRPGLRSFSRANGTSSGAAYHVASVCCASAAVPPRLDLAWQVALRKCVDASPLVVCHERSGGEEEAPRVVVGAHSGELVCVDAARRGAVVWTRTLGGRIEASAAFSARTGAVYVGTYGGALHALDLATGADRWVFRAAGAIKAAVRVVDELQLVVCGAYDRFVYGVDSASGAQRWTLSAGGGSVFSTPAYLAATRQLFVASTGGDVCCAALADAPDAPAVRWRRRLPAPVFSSLSVSPTTRLVFVGCADGALYALDAASGDVRWRHATERPVFSSPSVYSSGDGGECVLFGSHDGALRKVASASGALVWTAQLGSAVFGSPAVFDLVSDNARRRMCCVATVSGALVVCDEATGASVAHAGGDGALGELFSSPVVAAGLCLIGSRASRLYAFRLA